ncbi:MAG TPA: alpha/beta fold hydrolase [Candidatus Krumholzibacteria bacterium]|nr:alpha/beta fold hydrolase [Candidatus Krumholzibacteria bacterium]
MRSFLLACALLLVAATAAFLAVTSESFVGDWEGTLEGVGLRVVMHMKHDGGKWTALMESPDQGPGADPCDEVKVDGMKLYFALDKYNVEYAGTLSKDGNNIEGVFTQGQRMALTFARSGAAPSAPAPSAPVTPHPLAGDWAGTLDAGMKLRLAVHLVNNGGAWSGNMVSLDQGGGNIPFSAVTVDGNKLHLDVKVINGSYDGTWTGNTIKGTWSQNGNALPLDFARGDAASIPGPNRPQEPKPPFPYRSEDVTVPGPGGITLAGTLTTPNSNGSFPVVLLITGSGLQDRNEELMGHKPFLVLSDHLTRQGIAVLRLDDRGFGKSTGKGTAATTEDFVQDALAAVAFLKTRKEIDAKKIGLVGHSEGGIIAPIAASRSQDVAFIVMMAGVGVRADDLIVRQMSDLARANGTPDVSVQQIAAATRRMCQIAMTATDDTIMKKQADAVTDSLAAQLGALSPAAGQEAKGIQDLVLSPWFRYVLTLKPEETLRKVKQPVLAINGALDLQVSAKENLPAIEKALKEGGNKDVTVLELPGLNHLFQTAKTGSPMEYGTIEETMSPVALKTISDWILARTSTKKK